MVKVKSHNYIAHCCIRTTKWYAYLECIVDTSVSNHVMVDITCMNELWDIPPLVYIDILFLLYYYYVWFVIFILDWWASLFMHFKFCFSEYNKIMTEKPAWTNGVLLQYYYTKWSLARDLRKSSTWGALTHRNIQQSISFLNNVPRWLFLCRI